MHLQKRFERYIRKSRQKISMVLNLPVFPLTKTTAQNEMDNFRPNVLVLAKKACPRAPQNVPAASREVMMDSLDVDR